MEGEPSTRVERKGQEENKRGEVYKKGKGGGGTEKKAAPLGYTEFHDVR